MSDQLRWPAGTPVRPDGHGPGGGRFRGVGTPGVGGWAQLVADKIDRGWSNDRRGRADLLEAWFHRDKRDTEIEHLDGGETAQVHRHDLPDGRSFVIKWFTEEYDPEYDEGDDEGEYDPYEVVDAHDAGARVRAEVMTARVAELIGAPVPPVIVDPSSGATVVMGYVDGEPGWQFVRHAFRPIDWSTQPLDGAGGDAYRLGLLDLLVANSDRHPGNFLVTEDGRPVGIDHGGAEVFGEGDLYPPDSVGDLNPHGVFAGLYFNDERGSDWVPNPLHPDDIREVRRRLRALLIEKDSHGFPLLAEDELEYMEHVLDLLEPHAKGDRRLIP